MQRFKRGDKNDDDKNRYKLIDFCIIGDRITPKLQPLDLFLDEIIKGFCRDLHDTCILNASVNPISSYSFSLSCQFYITWIVSIWERVPVVLVRKAWTIRTYKTFDELQ